MIDKKMPEDVNAYLNSIIGTELNSKMFAKNNIKPDKKRAAIDIIDRLFFKQLDIQFLPEEVRKIFDFDELAAKAFACDIAGFRLFPVSDWIGTDIAAVIRSWGGDPAIYLPFIEKQKQALAEEKKYFEDQSAVQPEFIPKKKILTEDNGSLPSDPAKEKADSKALFNQGLAAVLANELPAEAIEQYNLLLISLLGSDQQFKQDLETALYSNDENLTTDPILLDGKESAPSIGNWLKDFIKINGSENFDDLAVAEYLSGSRNAKNLPAEEKKLVNDLIDLYRNLAFFPESMAGRQESEWEIIPEREDIQDALAEKAQIEEMRPRAAKTIKKTPSDDPIAALNKQLAQYAPGSLEYKALAQEMERLKKK